MKRSLPVVHPLPHFPTPPPLQGVVSLWERGGNDRKIDSKPVCHNPSCIREDLMFKFEEEKSSSSFFINKSSGHVLFDHEQQLRKAAEFCPTASEIGFFKNSCTADTGTYQNMKRHML